MGLALVALYSTLVNFNHITLNYKRGKKLRRDNIDTSHRHSAAAITSRNSTSTKIACRAGVILASECSVFS